ncbi:MAG: 3-dehydroquinate synthase [Acidimicrobiales bacterium]|jgi:5-deoxy-5-amino-3-dehydroquinate synthase|nr:3-dehydroquinate synthase [Acidimicrobiales bacterium]
MIEIKVPLSEGREYPVLVGANAREELDSVLPKDSQRVAIVTQENIGVNLNLEIANEIFLIPDGEEAKTLNTIESLCRSFTRWGLTRNDCIVGIGGGVVTDVAGFAAATYHRGTPVIHIPTSLLGQIDASIGGKTGVNLPEGKNLVGAFWQPTAVLCDTSVLDTLPKREMLSGYGEMAKYHFLGSGNLDDLNLEEKIARCVEIKAQVVASDEREAGTRAILNYGHTLGHALETTENYDLRHGEAIAIGLVFAAELAHRLGRIDQDRVEEHRLVVDQYGLSSMMPQGIEPDVIMEVMARDKKAINGLTFVLDGPDGVEVVTGIEPSIVRETIHHMDKR